jgi:hypothetical protein
MPKLLINGTLGNLPCNGGNTMATLQFVLGLQRLGFDVLFFEHLKPEGCWDTHDARCSFVDSVQRAYFARVMTAFSLAGQSSLLYEGGAEHWGVSLQDLLRFARDAEALIGIGGLTSLTEILGSVKKRIYIDQDPVYTQLWSGVYDVDLNLTRADTLFTFGLNIGAPGCPIPTCGRRWHKLLPVVDLEFWRSTKVVSDAEKLTTVASWRGYDPLEYQGEWYDQKAVEFKQFISLPSSIGRPVEVALSIYSHDYDDLRLLKEHGWGVVDPRIHVGDPWAYRAYLAHSRAELGIAKNAYVKARSGWFSDRSAAYLASGKPVLVQDTGLAEHLPLGTGLIPFRTLEELVEAVHDLDARYSDHCDGARKLAKEYLSAEKVLSVMLAEAHIA